MQTNRSEVERLIQALGGEVEAARFWQITRQAVSKFRRQGHIPRARMLHLRAAHPELFADGQDREAA